MKKNLSPNVKTINMHTREKIFADMLISQKRKWLYESKRFKLKTSHYTPDFYLPNENLYIEIIGTRQAYHANKKKISEFKTLYPNINFIILDYKGNPYPPKDRRIYPSIKRIKKGKYNHKCITCNYEWISDLKYPKSCLKCRSYVGIQLIPPIL